MPAVHCGVLIGNLRVCRYVLGGPQSLWRTIMYANMYASHFDLIWSGGTHLCDLTSSLRQSNDCLLYNANNLRKTSMGNTMFGGITYVLNQKALAGRSFWEPADGGAMTMETEIIQWRWPSTWWNWKLGTVYPPAFYHLLQPHEQVFNMSGIGGSGSGYRGIGAEFNRSELYNAVPSLRCTKRASGILIHA